MFSLVERTAQCAAVADTSPIQDLFRVTLVHGLGYKMKSGMKDIMWGVVMAGKCWWNEMDPVIT